MTKCKLISTAKHNLFLLYAPFYTIFSGISLEIDCLHYLSRQIIASSLHYFSIVFKFRRFSQVMENLRPGP